MQFTKPGPLPEPLIINVASVESIPAPPPLITPSPPYPNRLQLRPYPPSPPSLPPGDFPLANFDDPPSPTWPSENSLPLSGVVELVIDGQSFTTKTATLTKESDFFRRLLSESRDSVKPDGSRVIRLVDADPKLFEHILRYLRHGLFPHFYDRVDGFDHAKYAALREEAAHFQIEPLRSWLAGRRYRDMRRVTYTYKGMLSDSNVGNEFTKVSSDEELEFVPAWNSVRVYICPRGIEAHRGKRESCGKACKSARGEGGDQYVTEMEYDLIVIKKEYHWLPVCLF